MKLFQFKITELSRIMTVQIKLNKLHKIKKV